MKAVYTAFNDLFRERIEGSYAGFNYISILGSFTLFTLLFIYVTKDTL